ncbi:MULTISPECIES: ChaB family protein [unclassified Mesorhizobium]|nr:MULTISPECIES: ChaB family protein [unclassified Mesorhizobium]TGT72044.1 hypothetical protein EN809_018045 [Mesorhizobium sp. M2E.F.Ca.ET.166.01.1.1]TGV99242.1 hypothetical protein EN797_023205 [Mesorhizobium sp. M2E.F.Ca.ET.154.01.1.1]
MVIRSAVAIEYLDRGERREEIAHRAAWTAVKHRYHKQGNAWGPL